MIWRELLKNIIMHKDLKYYCSLFGKLRRDFKNGGAPHKPILLISLIQAFQQNLYNTNQITILPELVGLFKTNWASLVKTNHTCLFTLPFYHMSTEPFWNLVPNPGCEIWVKSKSSMRSFANLTTAIKHATIDIELLNLLQNKDESNVLLYFLLDKYFPETKSSFNNSGDNYIRDIVIQIVEEPFEQYQKRIVKIREELDSEQYEEEIYIRSNVFKREIPKIYNNTCCISGMRVDVVDNVSMIDACHIIPFSESFNDTISNGIALCPNLHRAFDRGLISIDKNYIVRLNNKFSEPNRTAYNIKQFEGTQIFLPDDLRFYPSIDSLNYHMNKWGFNK
jgi:putative restriction endonuclease